MLGSVPPNDLVLLVRHGQAEPSHPDGDAARRLTPAGREAFRAHAAGLAQAAVIRRVISSPYVRARDTAALLAEAAAAPAPALRPELGASAATAPGLVELVEAFGPGTAVVGHDPSITDAAAMLLDVDERQVRFAPGTAAALRPVDGRWRLVWVAVPGEPLREQF
jgi:phosphohistidine phosphatase